MALLLKNKSLLKLWGTPEERLNGPASFSSAKPRYWVGTARGEGDLGLETTDADSDIQSLSVDVFLYRSFSPVGFVCVLP